MVEDEQGFPSIRNVRILQSDEPGDVILIRTSASTGLISVLLAIAVFLGLFCSVAGISAFLKIPGIGIFMVTVGLGLAFIIITGVFAENEIRIDKGAKLLTVWGKLYRKMLLKPKTFSFEEIESIENEHSAIKLVLRDQKDVFITGLASLKYQDVTNLASFINNQCVAKSSVPRKEQ